VEQYRFNKNDMCEAKSESEDLDKLGQGFTLANPLEVVDTGDGSIPRLTFVNQNFEVDYKGVFGCAVSCKKNYG
jgi:hypothetical protein